MIATIRNFPRRLTAALVRFHRSDEASLSVEAVLVMPILFWAFAASYAFFDIYRAKNLSLKGNYAVSDLLSRETNPINMSYLNGTKKVFRYLTRSNSNSWLRVSVVHCTADCATDQRTLEVDWSKATDGLATYNDADIMDHFEPIIPLMASGERVIVVETGMDYNPPFSPALIGIGPRDFVDIVLTRPRFAPQLCWEGIGCGA